MPGDLLLWVVHLLEGASGGCLYPFAIKLSGSLGSMEWTGLSFLGASRLIKACSIKPVPIMEYL